VVLTNFWVVLTNFWVVLTTFWVLLTNYQVVFTNFCVYSTKKQDKFHTNKFFGIFFWVVLTNFCVFFNFSLAGSKIEKKKFFSVTSPDFTLYYEAIMVSGTHKLILLIDCKIDFGPLSNINCFPYEEMNRNE
jgi:hypothetical protein